MPTPKKPGAGRIEVRAEPWFTDLLAMAARKTGRTVSGYVRYALAEQLRRDGFDPEQGEPVRPPGRPTAEVASPSPAELATETKPKRKSNRSQGRKKNG